MPDVEKPPLPDTLPLLAELVAAPGPPGQEDAVREAVAAYLRALKVPFRVDAKGNLLAGTPGGASVPERPRVVVTAHLDEIALMVTGVEVDGALRVSPLGGAHPWKWGEGPVEVLAPGGPIPGVLSFGSIHTTSPLSPAQQVRDGHALTWDAARVLTGLDADALLAAGVRPGTRVIIARSRRGLWEMGGGLVGSYFLDDRADLVSWLQALAALVPAPPSPPAALAPPPPLPILGEGGTESAPAPGTPSPKGSRSARGGGGRGGEGGGILFAATAGEEVGGEGVQFLLQSLPAPPEIVVALEIGPRTPDADFPLDANPTVWVADSFTSSDPRDLDLLAAAARDIGLNIHWQAVTRGGSDATCAAARGLCARPVTLAFGAENSHGFEIMHRNAPENLARLLLAYLQRMP